MITEFQKGAAIASAPATIAAASWVVKALPWVQLVSLSLAGISAIVGTAWVIHQWRSRQK